jgi:hypothetical protein
MCPEDGRLQFRLVCGANDHFYHPVSRVLLNSAGDLGHPRMKYTHLDDHQC